ncbi:MAG: c-type cytochrome [Burkholderiaceae bacterium]|jgi:cytochrome c553|nr:cytochrome c4 [Polynucleobacter sp.]
MNRALPMFAKFVCVALMSLSVAWANEEKAPAAADPAKGSTLYSNGDPSRGILACVACHGAAGNSTITQNPKLAGQHDAYTQKQLHNFKGPDRNNAIMTGIAKALGEDDVRNIAAYLEQQKPAPGSARNKNTVDLGKKIYRAGIAEKQVPACAGCHGPNGAGIPAQYARLAGQHQDYTIAQLTNFRTGTRANSAQMTAVGKRMSDEEMQAVADYIAGLR